MATTLVFLWYPLRSRAFPCENRLAAKMHTRSRSSRSSDQSRPQTGRNGATSTKLTGTEGDLPRRHGPVDNLGYRAKPVRRLEAKL
jgi:hypothetical protein